MVVRRPSIATYFVLFSSVVACSGTVAGPATEQTETDPDSPSIGEPDNSAPVPPGQVPDADRCTDLSKTKPSLSPARMRRLSWQEINNAWTDLFAQSTPTELGNKTDIADRTGRSGTEVEVNESFVRDYRPALDRFADRVAKAITTTGECRTATPACVENQVLQLARKAWRHALIPEEKNFLQTRTAAFTAEIGNTDGLAAAIALVLASPRFLFLPDPGSLIADESIAGVFRSKGDQLAALWSAAVWGSVPDDALMTASAAGELATREGRSAQLDRMLSDPRAKRGFTLFFRSWFGHNQIMKTVKDEKLFPTFDDDVRKEMLIDTETTLNELVFDAKAAPNELLSSSLGTPGTKTVTILGWKTDSIEPRHQDLQKVGRHGVATHPSVLSMTSKTAITSIVNRGKFVVEKLVCGHVPEPPKNVNVDQANMDAATGKLTGRQVAEKHASDPACAGCHRFLDPFGVAFENFDAIGRRRTTDNGIPIDTSVELNDELGIKGKFSGANDLLNALAATGRTEQCFANSFASFVMPTEWTEAQSCALNKLALHDNAGAPSMLNIAKAFLLSDAFLSRSQASL
jgi:hypothetical protein